MRNDPADRVTVVDIDMPFWSMVRFMVKLAIAAIPAMLILWLLALLFTLLIGGIFGGIVRFPQVP
ncbi:MAG: hypothetical protein WD397_08225 [Wenzhouxiangellaceae bacterium]